MGALRNKRDRQSLKEAGELLPVEAIDRTGLTVTTEGAFVRILQITPPNPLILSEEERLGIARGYCRMVSRLRASQSLQFYVEARPMNLGEILTEARREVGFTAGPPPSSLDTEGEDPLATSRWRLYAAMEESLRLHADEQAAVRTSFYVVCPYMPVQRRGYEMLRELLPRRGKLPTASLTRTLKAHQRAARESFAFTETVRSELDSLAIPSRVINGEEVLSLLWGRFNPTQADRGVRKPPRATEILGELDREVDSQEAREVAQRLRGLIAQSPMDFDRSHHHVEIDRDVEQTMWVATTADQTQMGWLMGAMMTREPFTMSVHVRALDRRRERTKVKMRYRRVYAVNRGAESRGRVPDFDRYAQEEESAHLLREMAGHERAGLFETSIYLAIRGRGPEPDLAALGEAADFCAEALSSSCDVAVNRGAHHQRRLWPSTLPLGRDVAKYSRVYATRNVGDCVPLVGTSCGSPSGVPFAFASPGRTLERLNPSDRLHENHSVVIAGKSGAGKTLMTLTIMARCLALGIGRVFVIDRSRHHQHYLTLTNLVHGARHLDIGSESEWAINAWDTPDQSVVPRAKVAFLLALHGTMMGSEGLTVLERSHLGTAIREVYARAHEQGVTARESMLRDVLVDRAREETDAGAAEIAAALRNLAGRLGEFCGDGTYSHLLDRETNIPLDSPLVVFDTKQCPEEVLGAVMFATIEYVTREVIRHSDEHAPLVGKPDVPVLHHQSMLVIDEAWHKVATPESGTHVAALARQARHIDLFLLILSQQFSDLGTDHGLPLLRNAAIAILLRQDDQRELQFAQQALGLSDETTALIANLQTVKGRYSEFLWLNGARGTGKLRLPVGPTEYWTFTSEPHTDVPMRNATIAAHDGQVWPALRELARGGVPADGNE
jgi:TraG P-loop domain